MSNIQIVGEGELLVIERLAAALEKAASVDEIKDVRDRAMAIQLYARKKAGGLAAAQAAGRVVTDATLMLARLYAEEKSQQASGLKQGPRLDCKQDGPGKVAIAKAADVDPAALSRLRPIVEAPKAAVKQAVRAIEQRGEVVTPSALLREFADTKRETRRTETLAKLDDTAAREVKAAAGVYDVIVIDPPWPMEKIERDVRPNQVEFDYQTMTEDELRELVVPCADDCHVWLWTTHRFLPMALRLLDTWTLKYVCTFVWHKPGGFQPIGLPQYNCEFALYARRGSPIFVDIKALPTCFEAPRGAHSEKPEAFYATLRRVTAGRRLDMFNRREIEGFDGWGKESAA